MVYCKGYRKHEQGEDFPVVYGKGEAIQLLGRMFQKTHRAKRKAAFLLWGLCDTSMASSLSVLLERDRLRWGTGREAVGFQKQPITRAGGSVEVSQRQGPMLLHTASENGTRWWSGSSGRVAMLNRAFIHPVIRLLYK